MRLGIPPLMALLLLQGTPVSRGESGVLLERMLLAEDARAPREAHRALLLGALEHPDFPIAERAARALGRLEQAGFAQPLLRLLEAPRASLRRAAAEALGQSAQGFRGDSSPAGRGAAWTALVRALRGRLRLERQPGVREMVALSLGRLPYVDPAEIAAVAPELVSACEAGVDRCRGVELLLRATWRRRAPDPLLVQRLAEVVRRPAHGVAARRHALGALLAAQAADDATLASAGRAADPELRRLALTGIRLVAGRASMPSLLERGLGDPDPAVRLEALRGLARVGGAPGCARFAAATADPVPRVALMALDLLGGCAGDEAVIDALLGAGGLAASGPARRQATDPVAWHRGAHALVALARAAPGRAALLIPGHTADPVWQRRMYAARAAALTGDTATLARLAGDPSPNVAAAAVAGLRQVGGHAGDSRFRDALRSSDFQLVLTAAEALAGTPDKPAATAALLLALGRLTLQQAETSRDARVALLVRLGEVAGAEQAAALEPYLRDFDPVVADSAAALLTRQSGTGRVADPPIRTPDPVTLAEIEELRGARLVFTMAGERQFTVELLVDEAPVMVARIARLVRRRYYDGLTFHRMAPNFVIQGGSPGANEYAGVPEFFRDELGATSHARGTLGMSTRGRDTGDGQLFINLRDNPRLDFEYTVWGRVVAGLGVVDAVLEGDEIRRVEIRSR
jgi:cyclophilin family peptidyl-prolyl cis-trans isomerase/HEAT repeat protein